MQYTNNILDLLITIGCNIQYVSAYRSTGMELRFFIHSGSTRSKLHFVAHSSDLYYDDVEV